MKLTRMIVVQDSGPKLTRSLSHEEEEGEPVSSSRYLILFNNNILYLIIKQASFPNLFVLFVGSSTPRTWLAIRTHSRFHNTFIFKTKRQSNSKSEVIFGLPKRLKRLSVSRTEVTLLSTWSVPWPATPFW